MDSGTIDDIQKAEAYKTTKLSTKILAERISKGLLPETAYQLHAYYSNVKIGHSKKVLLKRLELLAVIKKLSDGEVYSLVIYYSGYLCFPFYFCFITAKNTRPKFSSSPGLILSVHSDLQFGTRAA